MQEQSSPDADPSATWINPYQVTMRGADTLNLVFEGRLYVRWPLGDIPTWHFVGGGPGSWAQAALDYATLFFQAGLIQPLDRLESMNQPVKVVLTKAGRYLFATWRDHPFTVINRETMSVEQAMATIREVYGDALDELGKR